MILSVALFVDRRRLPRLHLKLMFLFFSLFLFLNLNFLSSTIQTERISVDTSSIVDSTSKLIATRSILAFSEDSYDLVRSAPEGSFLKGLNRKDVLVIYGVSDIIRMKTSGLNKYVIFAHEIGVAYWISLMAGHSKEIGSVAFVKPTSYFESLFGFQMRRGLKDEIKRFINKG